MIQLRVFLWLVGFLGAVYALIGLFEGLPQVGIGLAVTAASIVGWGLIDWIEER